MSVEKQRPSSNPIEDHDLVTTVNRSLTWLPASWVPYGELIRLHRPVGILNVSFPYLFGSLLAALESPAVGPAELLIVCLKMFTLGFVLRSIGCAWNDIIDRDLDRRTERCKNRPVARGAIAVSKACCFTAALLGLWVLLLVCTATASASLYAVPVPLLTAFYPFTKRFTSLAQLVLGLTLSWGIFVGAAQLHLHVVDALKYSYGRPCAYALLSLFAAYVVFSLFHDTIYAFQDIKDDRKNGAKSTATLFEHHAVSMLAVLNMCQVLTLAAVGILLELESPYYVITCCGVGLLFALAIYEADIQRPEACGMWFKATSLGFSLLVFVGLLWEYIASHWYQLFVW